MRDTKMTTVCVSCKLATEATTWAPVMGRNSDPEPEPVSLDDSYGTIDNQRVTETSKALKENQRVRAKKAQLTVKPKYSRRYLGPL